VRQKQFTELDPDLAADLFLLTRDVTAAAGLPAYEISNHARPGQESRHNLTYWRYGDYVGVGPGAHGRRNGLATVRHRKPENFLGAVAREGHGIAEERKLGTREQAAEALLMGLRLREGIDPGAIARRFELDPAALIDCKRRDLYIAQGLLRETPDRLIVTDAGMPLLDALLGELVPAALVAA
jgi:coproporphyrinogen III oxidase-like Fe-S oxidoreductase